MVRKTIVVLALALIAMGTSEGGQDRFGADVQVTIVEVPVTVADPSGKPIRGLVRENFELYDEGKRVPIEYFDVIDLQAIRSGEPKPVPAAARRNFLLLFDLANSTPVTIRRAQDAARTFVSGREGSLDLVAVATSSAEQGVKLLTSFTTDREFLIGTIATLTQEAGFKVADPLMLTVAKDSVVSTAPMKAELNETKAEERREANALTGQLRSEEMRNRVGSQLKNYATLARVLDRVRGQKQIILLSEGFDARLITGRNELGFQATQRENDAVLSGELWKVDTDQRFGSAAGTNAISEMAEIFRRSDVRLHAIDIRGLRTDVDANEGFRKSSDEALSLLANPTGGTVFRNSNDLGGSFDRVVESQEIIYLLGFRAPSSSPRKFHPLKVKLVKTRGEVTHRSGYFESSRQDHDLERVLSAGEIMMNNLPTDEVKISALAAPFLRPDGLADVPVIVEVDGPSLLDDSSGPNLAVEFFIYAFDEDNLIRDHVFERAVLDVAKLRERLASAGAKFYHTLRLPPGDYSVRVLVRTSGANHGFRSTALTVPKPGTRFVAPPLVFDHDVSRWVMIRGAVRKGVSPEYPFQIGEKVFVPAAAPVFERGKRREMAIFAYNADENVDATARVGIRDEAQAAPVTLVGRSDGEGNVEKLLLTVEAPSVRPGPHQLLVKVRDKSGARENEVMLPIVIR